MTDTWFFTIEGVDAADRSAAEQQIAGVIQSLPAEVARRLSQEAQITFPEPHRTVLAVVALKRDAVELEEALRLKLQSLQFKGTITMRRGENTGRAAHAANPVTADRVVQVLRNAVSIRLIFGAILIGAIVGAVTWTWLGFAVAAIAWLFGTFNPYNVLYCPHCSKRVKAGASACHHCGRVVVPQ